MGEMGSNTFTYLFLFQSGFCSCYSTKTVLVQVYGDFHYANIQCSFLHLHRISLSGTLKTLDLFLFLKYCLCLASRTPYTLGFSLTSLALLILLCWFVVFSLALRAQSSRLFSVQTHLCGDQIQSHGFKQFVLYFGNSQISTLRSALFPELQTQVLVIPNLKYPNHFLLFLSKTCSTFGISVEGNQMIWLFGLKILQSPLSPFLSYPMANSTTASYFQCYHHGLPLSLAG